MCAPLSCVMLVLDTSIQEARRASAILRNLYPQLHRVIDSLCDQFSPGFPGLFSF